MKEIKGECRVFFKKKLPFEFKDRKASSVAMPKWATMPFNAIFYGICLNSYSKSMIKG